jgi:hypothetical protein
MVTFAQAAQNTMQPSFTANGMVTNQSSLDPNVDLFFAIGASRGKDLTGAFARAYAAEPDVAMKILFWARDARGGAGEREIFRKILQNLEVNQPDSLMRNLALVSEYGRWDDLLVFATPQFKMAAYDLIARALRGGNGLAAKWMPRKGPIANDLRKYLNFTPKQYRQMIVGLTKVVETQMCAKEWDQINYDHVPSVAANRYQKAFNKRDATRYAAWKEGLKDGTSKVNASVLYPYDVLKAVDHGDRAVALAQWEALPNYLGDNAILPMVDVSGSMSCQVGGQKGVGLTCMQVAISLGLYIADKQQGAFKDMWLTFTSDSHIDILKGDLLAKINQVRRNVGYDTNLESAFRSILQVAVQNRVPAEEMPKYLLVLSDMEFNPAWAGGVSLGAFDLAKRMFEAAGYELPKLVWWNLNARPDATGNSPVRFDQRGTAMVSGFSPSIMKSILAAKNFSPRDVMLETIMGERYQAVKA